MITNFKSFGLADSLTGTRKQSKKFQQIYCDRIPSYDKCEERNSWGRYRVRTRAELAAARRGGSGNKFRNGISSVSFYREGKTLSSRRLRAART